MKRRNKFWETFSAEVSYKATTDQADKKSLSRKLFANIKKYEILNSRR
jgi:hypothetical protein